MVCDIFFLLFNIRSIAPCHTLSLVFNLHINIKRKLSIENRNPVIYEDHNMDSSRVPLHLSGSHHGFQQGVLNICPDHTMDSSRVSLHLSRSHHGFQQCVLTSALEPDCPTHKHGSPADARAALQGGDVSGLSDDRR